MIRGRRRGGGGMWYDAVGTIPRRKTLKFIMFKETVRQEQQTFVESTLSSVVAALQRELGERMMALVLFGSRARGDATSTSDWDLFLVATQLPERPFQRHLYIKRILPREWRAALAILAKTPTEFESTLIPLYLDLAMDGILLYDSDNYMTNHLAAIRQTLQKKGLYRIQDGRELVWRWGKAPKVEWELEWGPVR